MEWKISSEEEGIKLGAFLSKRLGKEYSSRQIKKYLEGHLCRVNGKIERFSSLSLVKNDAIYFDLSKISKTSSPWTIEPSRLLYEDEDFLFYDKPSGITSSEQGILKLLRKCWPTLVLVHRLDKETTGVLILAKSPAIFEAMVKLFRLQQVKKTYWAWVSGVPLKSEGVIISYLAKIKEKEGQVLWGSVAKGGLKSCTKWKCEKKGKGIALLACFPLTGRTHQIRVHLSEMGHPILGDYRYSQNFRAPYQPSRTLLHAKNVEFNHPLTGKTLRVEAPIPKDFMEYLEKPA